MAAEVGDGEGRGDLRVDTGGQGEKTAGTEGYWRVLWAWELPRETLKTRGLVVDAEHDGHRVFAAGASL